MPETTPLSLQLYTARKFPPLAEHLRLLARLGYTNVEPFGGLYDDVAGLKRELDANRMTAPSGHIALDLLESDPDRAVAIARTLGIELVVAPYLVPEQRPADRAGWVALGQRLARVADRLKAAGFRFAWHNHDFEFRPLPDGSFPIEHLLVDGVLWEADLAWVAKADADPAPWLDRYAGRIPAVHVKDIARPGENADEDGWADVGTGVLPWPALWSRAKKAGAELMIVEHDNPSDLERFARVSAEAVRKMAAGDR